MSLRVLMIAPTPFFGDRGCHVRILEEIRALAEQGVRVLLLTYPLGKDAPGVEIRRIKGFGLSGAEKPGPQWAKFALDAVMVKEAWKAAREFEPDVIHGHLHEGCLIGRFVGKMTGKPLIFDYQGSLTGEMSHHGFLSPGTASFAFFRAIEKAIDRTPDMTIASSGAMAQSAVGVNGAKLRIVQDAVELDEFKPMDRDAGLAEKLGLPHDVPVCVFLGLLNTYQGVDLLLESVSAIKKKHGRKVHFLIMGYPGVEYYSAKAQAAGIADCVTFTGRIAYEDAAKYLNLGDFAVAPKIAATESNGKVINYIACGLTTVALDTPVNRELLGETAYFVERRESQTETASNLAEALVNVSENNELRAKIGQAGRARAIELFSRTRMAQELTAAYKAVI